MADDDLVRRLREAGDTGLDLSPGDPLAAEAADALERLTGKTTGDALRLAASFLYELRNAVSLPVFERLMGMRSELDELAEVEDPLETPYDWVPTGRHRGWQPGPRDQVEARTRRLAEEPDDG